MGFKVAINPYDNQGEEEYIVTSLCFRLYPEIALFFLFSYKCKSKAMILESPILYIRIKACLGVPKTWIKQERIQYVFQRPTPYFCQYVQPKKAKQNFFKKNLKIQEGVNFSKRFSDELSHQIGEF